MVGHVMVVDPHSDAKSKAGDDGKSKADDDDKEKEEKGVVKEGTAAAGDYMTLGDISQDVFQKK